MGEHIEVSNEVLLNRVKFVIGIRKLSKDIKKDIVEKYNIAARYYYKHDESLADQITNNMELYLLLRSSMIYRYLSTKNIKMITTDIEEGGKPGPLARMFNSVDNFNKVMSQVTGVSTQDIDMQEGSVNKIVELLKAFDISKTTDTKDADVASPEELEKEADGVNFDDKEITRKELRARIKEDYGQQIKLIVKDLVKVMLALYSSGFTAMPQAGLLVNFEDSEEEMAKNNINKLDLSPLIKLNTDSSRVVFVKKDILFEQKIMKVIRAQLPQLARYAKTQGDDAVPDIKELMTRQDNVVCHKLHLGFQTACIKSCTGNISIHRWITEEMLPSSNCSTAEEWMKTVNKNTSTLTNLKNIEKWYRWCLTNTFIEDLIEAGVKDRSDEELATNVLEVLNRNLRNVVVESDRAVGEQIELRISTDAPIDIDSLIDGISRELNIGNSTSIKVNQIAKDGYARNKVLTLQIVLDEEAANKANLFAGDIIERLVEAGVRPSWSHAMLGKKEDGSIMYWDGFMDPGKAGPENRCYTIYAGSRSGKGVMTSTLVANALADGKQIFYTDGKPENGVCVGSIAWEQQKEAYVFDGKPIGAIPFDGYMENYTNGVRNPSEVSEYLDKLPKALFENKIFQEADVKKFLGLMRYLKSMSLCASIIEGRAGSTLPLDNWQVWIFDEMSNMSKNELNIRKKFAQYLNAKGISADPSLNASKLRKTKGFAEMITSTSDKYDVGIAYINNWVTWLDNLKTLISTASTISLGKANLNLIFIFQEPKWLSPHEKGDEEKHYNITTLASIAKNLKSTKIAGRKAIPRNSGEAAGEYGDATMKFPWIDKIDEGTGWWVISKGSNIKSGDVELFKPFNVWTVPLVNGRMVTLEQLKASDPGAANYKASYYFKGYVEMLFSGGEQSPADILESAYDYANNAVSTLGLAQTLKEYLYDCTNFSGKDTSMTLEEIKDSYENAESENVHESYGPSSIPSDVFDEADENVDESNVQGNTGQTEEWNGNKQVTNANRHSDEELYGLSLGIITQICNTKRVYIDNNKKDQIAQMCMQVLRSWGW